ncbi:MAG: GerMN domain-containing protein [Peptococcaceae bacterium]|nr:GerMN domain-containing protein [Peptococcaceae bacterium]
MQKTRLFITCILCIAAIMMLVGCNILNDLIKDGGGNGPLGNLLNKTTDKNKDGSAVPVISNSTQGENQIKLYFSDKSGKKLVEVNRTIPKTLSLARETVHQWLVGPSGSTDSYPVVSPQTTFRDISIKNGIATVDLSKEFLQPYSNVAAETTLYGLVNTVSQFSSVQLVKIRVEGQEIKTFRGINLSDLRFRNDLIGFSAGPVTQGGSSQTPGVSQQDDSKTATGSEKKESPSTMNIFVN